MALYWVWSGWILGDGSTVHCCFPCHVDFASCTCNWLNSASGQRRWASISGTNPKSFSGRMSDRANVLGRVLRPDCRSRARSRKPRGPRGNLAHLAASGADCARSCTAFCALDVSSLAGLLHGLRNGPRWNVRVLVQMRPRESLEPLRGMRLGDREGRGQWLRRRSLQAFASRAACQREEGYDKPKYCPRTSFERRFYCFRNWRQSWSRPAYWCPPY